MILKDFQNGSIRAKMPFTKHVLGWKFLCGAGAQDEQARDYTEIDGVTEQRADDFMCLVYGINTPIPWRFQSSRLVGSRLVEAGGGYATHTATVSELMQWTTANANVTNVNNYFECLLGDQDAGMDIACRMAFDVDLKSGRLADLLPAPEYFTNRELFVPWIVDKLCGFLLETYGETVTPNQLRVSSSNRPFTEDQIGFILDKTEKNGVQSYHVLVEHLVLRNMQERDAHSDMVREYFAPLDGIVDPGVYTKNRNMRALGSQKLNKCAMMPLSRAGDMVFADHVDYASWRDIPAETVLAHMWTMVPRDARGMDPARFKSRRITEPAVKTNKRQLVPRRTAELGEAAEELKAHFFRGVGGAVGFVPEAFSFKDKMLPDGTLEIHCDMTDRSQPRPCLVRDASGAVRRHDSNGFKLVLKPSGTAEYVCFGSARPCVMLDSLDDETAAVTRKPIRSAAAVPEEPETSDSDAEDTAMVTEPPQTRVRVRATVACGTKCCCAVPLGRLPPKQFEFTADATVPSNEAGRLANFNPSAVLMNMGKPVSTALAVRGPHGSGKTTRRRGSRW